MKAKVCSINISKVKGMAKTPVPSARLIEDFGVEGDVHAGDKIKQVSLLAFESIKKMSKDLKPGDFAENITTEGIELRDLEIGQKLRIGCDIILEITKIGKDCHRYCAIYYKTGDCIMPREGIFAKVLDGGEISVGDGIEVIANV
jgi:MOSC domain-containing protein YiiM